MVLLSIVLAASGAVAAPELEEAYRNPVDGKTYSAEGGWRTYEPKSGIVKSEEKVSLGAVRLLQDNDTIGARTTAAEIAAFIESAVAAGAAVFADHTSPVTLLVQFQCLPQRHSVKLAYDGDASNEQLQAFYDRLGSLPPLAVSDEVLFQFSVVVVP
jgi:hypothetical protein